MLSKWEKLPDFMRIPEVRPYWEFLNGKRAEIFFKRVSDIVTACLLLLLLSLPMAVIAFLIKTDSKGPAIYRQERVTKNGKRFRIHKFRTMVEGAETIGTAVTPGKDPRITGIGEKLRRLRLDEIPQLFDVLSGNMSFVGTRPEAVKYVERYLPAYYATLLLPAGITSEASIRYMDEEKLLEAAEDVDKVYIEDVLPQKMKINLESVRNFGFFRDIGTMFRTVFAVFGGKKE